MKTCTVCKDPKDLSCFAFKSKVKGTLQPLCKDCHNEKIRKHYAENKTYYKDKAKVRSKSLSLENRERIIEYLLAHPCVDCGETELILLQFDHLGDKEYNVSEMITRYSWTAILKEIEKCEVVCAHDHIRRTAKRAGWHKLRAGIA